MFSILGSLLTWVLGLFFGKKDGPKIEEIAASNATAQAELTQEHAANVVITQASAARASADAGIVRAESAAPDQSDASVNAALKQQFPGDFRTDS